MRKFKIFYSWQSDLPGNKTRNFIRDCIDEAIDLPKSLKRLKLKETRLLKTQLVLPTL